RAAPSQNAFWQTLERGRAPASLCSGLLSGLPKDAAASLQHLVVAMLLPAAQRLARTPFGRLWNGEEHRRLRAVGLSAAPVFGPSAIWQNPETKKPALGVP